MKTRFRTSKKIPLALLTAVILAGCDKPENTNDNEPESREAQTATTAPSVGLHEAALEGNVQAVRQHVAAGSDLNERDPSGGASPLITAAAFGQTEVVEVLIEAGADLNFRNNQGDTALSTAAFLCRTEIVRVLLEKGADKNTRNNAGVTALESVSGPFGDVKGVYDFLGAALGPLGLKLDYSQIMTTRPKIAEMLR